MEDLTLTAHLSLSDCKKKRKQCMWIFVITDSLCVCDGQYNICLHRVYGCHS